MWIVGNDKKSKIAKLNLSASVIFRMMKNIIPYTAKIMWFSIQRAQFIRRCKSDYMMYASHHIASRQMKMSRMTTNLHLYSLLHKIKNTTNMHQTFVTFNEFHDMLHKRFMDIQQKNFYWYDYIELHRADSPHHRWWWDNGNKVVLLYINVYILHSLQIVIKKYIIQKANY